MYDWLENPDREKQTKESRLGKIVHGLTQATLGVVLTASPLITTYFFGREIWDFKGVNIIPSVYFGLLVAGHVGAGVFLLNRARQTFKEVREEDYRYSIRLDK